MRLNAARRRELRQLVRAGLASPGGGGARPLGAAELPELPTQQPVGSG